jgi:hypothetical protein
VMYRFRSVMPNARRAPDVTGCESASRIPRHCPGQKPPFCAVKRPVHLYKNAIERKVTAKNAKAAYTPRAGPDSQREAECVVDDDVVEDQAEAGARAGTISTAPPRRSRWGRPVDVLAAPGARVEQREGRAGQAVQNAPRPREQLLLAAPRPLHLRLSAPAPLVCAVPPCVQSR